MRPVVYSSEQVQAWEQHWLVAGNSSYGLMQQAAWQMTQHIQRFIVQCNEKLKRAPDFSNSQLNQPTILRQYGFGVGSDFGIGVWCGAGNNGGDGWLIAAYLKQAGFNAWVFEVAAPQTTDAKLAKQYAQETGINIYQQFNALPHSQLSIDAMFGIGVSRQVSGHFHTAIEQFNQGISHKIAIDIPSGLHPDTGAVLGAACVVDFTLTVIAYKAGLFTGQGKAYAGQVQLIELIPPYDHIPSLAALDLHAPILAKRKATGHKGSYGHVLIIGGDENMGGASIMSAQAALAVGAGKVTLLTQQQHHSAALTRCPNMMTLSMPDIEQINPEFASQVVQGIDCIVIGMGLGRHAWGSAVWQAFLPVLKSSSEIKTVVVDADALWHLANAPLMDTKQHAHWYLTPHSGEAARLLGCDVQTIEQDRIAAIYQVYEKFGGHILLKGAGSLSLDAQGLSICALGNAGMATAGMGDILAGMAGGLLAQLPDLAMHEIVALHAAAGDLLAQDGERGLEATAMLNMIKQVVN